MFTAKQQVLLQVAAATAIVFFLARIGGTETGASLLWGLLVGFVLFRVLRQNFLVAGGSDVMRDVHAVSIGPAARVVGETFGVTRETPTAPEAAQARPQTLAGPRGGKADDLKRISGVGPKLEKALNAEGIYHFDQIAAWGPAEIDWADNSLAGVKGQASRSDWVGQAKALLAEG